MSIDEPWHRSIRTKYRNYFLNKQCADVARQLKNAINKCGDDIPVLIISYNNGVYVQNTIRQLAAFCVTPIVIDNNSDDASTLKILDEIRRSGSAQLVVSDKNFGHMVGFLDPIYKLLPNVFAYTDPDLKFCANLPPDFLSILAELTTRYSVYKAGFALDLRAGAATTGAVHSISKRRPMSYKKDFTIDEWESRYWNKRIVHDALEVYAAPIDTTFAVYRKENYRGDFLDAVRVAGNYSAIHLPWFPELELMRDVERTSYIRGNISSTWLGSRRS